MKVIYHRPNPGQGVEVVIAEDSHGRKIHVHAPILSGEPCDVFIKRELDQFEAQEKKLAEHIEARFDPKTRERRK